MRDLEGVLVDRLIAVEQQVEIDRARSVTGAFAPDAAEVALDLQQEVQQLAWGPGRRQARRRIEKARLILVADRVRLDRKSRAQERRPLVLVDSAEGCCDHPFALSQIGAESDIGNCAF